MQDWLELHREARDEAYKAFRARRDGKGELALEEKIHYAKAAGLEADALTIILAGESYGNLTKGLAKRVIEFATNIVSWTFKAGMYEVAQQRARTYCKMVGDGGIWSGVEGWYNDPAWNLYWGRFRSPSNYESLGGDRYLDVGTGEVVEADFEGVPFDDIEYQCAIIEAIMKRRKERKIELGHVPYLN